jgi:hypothetical protein
MNASFAPACLASCSSLVDLGLVALCCSGRALPTRANRTPLQASRHPASAAISGIQHEVAVDTPLLSCVLHTIHVCAAADRHGRGRCAPALD